MKAITRRQAEKIGERTGYPITEGNGRTFYATNEQESGVWEYDSKAERDEAVKRSGKEVIHEGILKGCKN